MIKRKVTKEVIDHYDALVAKRDKLKEEWEQNHNDELQDEIGTLLTEIAILEHSYDLSCEVFEENGKKGLKNVRGEVVVPAMYEDYRKAYYPQTECTAQKDGRWGVVAMDGTGKPLTEFIYSDIQNNAGFKRVWIEGDGEHENPFALMVDHKVITDYEIYDYITVDGFYHKLFGVNGVGLFFFDEDAENGYVYVKPEYDEDILNKESFTEGDINFKKDGKEVS